ncbi:chromosome partitioning protein, ParA family [Scytonema sp. HK-05]|nr:ParA family protein [Scytonema sp. HK-05]OKH58734.1 hypothetical protein NIES2130_12720 [Scytonema sp. HK-05]BAY43406.1 chromosome partitioning protein, ParA family [Scytonema sp. HK-05]
MRSQSFEFIIFDTPARPNDVEVEELASGCDLLIVPTPPDLLSMDAMALMAKSLPEDTNWRVLLTMVPPPPQKDGLEAIKALKTQGYPVFSRGIRFYKAYKDAVTSGVPVYKVRGGKVAWRDWTELKVDTRFIICTAVASTGGTPATHCLLYLRASAVLNIH